MAAPRHARTHTKNKGGRPPVSDEPLRKIYAMVPESSFDRIWEAAQEMGLPLRHYLTYCVLTVQGDPLPGYIVRILEKAEAERRSEAEAGQEELQDELLAS